jgi:hypothetical protein
VQLQLHALAYNLANFLRTLGLPGEMTVPRALFAGSCGASICCAAHPCRRRDAAERAGAEADGELCAER